MNVSINGRKILHNINLQVYENELHVIIGPNGAGKSTLLAVIAGIPKYVIESGKIIYNGEDITNELITKRVEKGIVLAYQIPPTIKTITAKDLVSTLLTKFKQRECKYSDFTGKLLEIEYLLDRPLFYGFSGGERKRFELYITSLMCPKLLLLDEPDSGVDIDSLDKIAKTINYLLDQGTTIILVTHRGDIINKLKKVDKVHVMCNGKIALSNGVDIIHEIFSKGFEEVCKLSKS